MSVPTLLEAWHAPEDDPGIRLFAACLRAWQFDLPASATVLELGCLESDFALHLKRARPDVTVIGIDVRDRADIGPQPVRGHGDPSGYPGDRFVRGDASDGEVWREAGPGAEWTVNGHAAFDAVIALSSVEHFGLGWYGDPLRPNADERALREAQWWLKPTGWLYYDVPWHPDTYAQTGHYRRYTDATLPHVRAGGYVEHARTWVWPERESTLLHRPAVHGDNPHPFHYCAVWAGVR